MVSSQLIQDPIVKPVFSALPESADNDAEATLQLHALEVDQAVCALLGLDRRYAILMASLGRRQSPLLEIDLDELGYVELAQRHHVALSSVNAACGLGRGAEESIGARQVIGCERQRPD